VIAEDLAGQTASLTRRAGCQSAVHQASILAAESAKLADIRCASANLNSTV